MAGFHTQDLLSPTPVYHCRWVLFLLDVSCVLIRVSFRIPSGRGALSVLRVVSVAREDVISNRLINLSNGPLFSTCAQVGLLT